MVMEKRERWKRLEEDVGEKGIRVVDNEIEKEEWEGVKEEDKMEERDRERQKMERDFELV